MQFPVPEKQWHRPLDQHLQTETIITRNYEYAPAQSQSLHMQSKTVFVAALHHGHPLHERFSRSVTALLVLMISRGSENGAGGNEAFVSIIEILS